MKYFTIAELCKSETADRLGIDNRCKKEHVYNMTALVDNVLDPLREAYGKPIQVNSGFRCLALNKAVKGSATSDHMTGRAADITGGSQLIDEKNFSWVHVSYRKEGNRKQILAL